MSCALTAGYALGCRESVGGVRDIRIAEYNPTASLTVSSGTVNWLYGYGLENLLLQSVTLNAPGGWTKNGGILVQDQNNPAPDGVANSASRVQFANGDSWLAQDVSLTTGTTYTFSCFVKNQIFNNSSQYFGMMAYKDGNTYTQLSIFPFDHQNTSLYYQPASAYVGVPTWKQENFGNGWYRYSMTFTPSEYYPSGNTTMQFYGSTASIGGAIRRCFIWGTQLERSDYAGYFIQTTTASSYVGKPFFQYELPKQTATMNETEIVSPENGTLYYQQDLTLIENKLNIVLRNEFHNMAQIKTIAIVNDRNGTKWMLGSDTGLEVTEGTAQTGLQQTDRTGYEITLTGLESYPMYGVNEALSIASGGGVEPPLPDGTSQQQSGIGVVSAQELIIVPSP
jgi:hypothetical protein